MSAQLRWYAKARASLYAGKINFLNDDIKIALLGSGYVPDQNADEKWSDISAFEISGSGYDAGGQTLLNKLVTYDPATKKTALKADDAQWPAATIAGRNVVCYDNTHPDKPLLGFSDYGDFSCTNGNFKVRFSPNGMFTDTLNP
jgi:hypothetical protein